MIQQPEMHRQTHQLTPPLRHDVDIPPARTVRRYDAVELQYPPVLLSRRLFSPVRWKNITALGCICCSTVINNLLVRGTPFFCPPSFPPLHLDRFALVLGMSMFLSLKPHAIVDVRDLVTSF